MTVFASGEGGRLLTTYVAEDTFNTTPSTPTMLTTRCTGFNMNPTKAANVSEEIGVSQPKNVRLGPQRNAGDMSIELSYGTYDDFLAALLRGSWSTDVLKVGTTFSSFTFENKFTAVAAEYEIFRGVIFDTLSLDCKPETIVTGSFGMLAASIEPAAATLDADPTAASTTLPFDSFSGSISEGGVELFTITGLNLSIQNNAELGLVIGSTTAQTQNRGVFSVTGSIDAYYADNTLIDKFLNETSSSLTLVLSDAAGNSLTIDFSNIKYTGSTKNIGSGPIMLNMPFQALYDSTDESSILITRAAA